MPRARSYLAGLAPAALVVLAASCSVDTELAVAAEIDSARVTVAGTGDAAAASTLLQVRFRVGDHALGPRTFEVTRAEIYVGEQYAATVALERPVGFDGTLGPGESTDAVLMGTTPAPGADSVLCGATAARVIVAWAHRDATDPSSLPEMDSAEVETTDITCM